MKGVCDQQMKRVSKKVWGNGPVGAPGRPLLGLGPAWGWQERREELI